MVAGVWLLTWPARVTSRDCCTSPYLPPCLTPSAGHRLIPWLYFKRNSTKNWRQTRRGIALILPLSSKQCGIHNNCNSIVVHKSLTEPGGRANTYVHEHDMSVFHMLMVGRSYFIALQSKPPPTFRNTHSVCRRLVPHSVDSRSHSQSVVQLQFLYHLKGAISEMKDYNPWNQKIIMLKINQSQAPSNLQEGLLNLFF